MKMLTSPSQALGEGPSSLRTETDVRVAQSQGACVGVKHWVCPRHLRVVEVEQWAVWLTRRMHSSNTRVWVPMKHLELF